MRVWPARLIFNVGLELWYGVSVALFLASSPGSLPLSVRGSLLSEGYLMDSHKLIALQTALVSLTMTPFVERFQQRDDPGRVCFFALAFLSFFGFHKSYILSYNFFLAFKRSYMFRHV